MILAMVVAIVSALTFGTAAWADELPSPMSPARLINDFAGLMDEQGKEALEDSLVRFARHQSTQITIVTVNDIDGYDIAQYAQELAKKWGVGQKGKDNGVIILVKPKTDDSRGQAFIGTGYGAEGALPDVICTRIVNEKMIPFFKDGNYSGGIRVGALAVMQAIDGEYTADEEDDSDKIASLLFLIFIVILVVLIFIAANDDNKKNGSGKRYITHSTGNEWLAATIINSALSGGRSSGSFGGGGFGGFGGFGGGSFGGGGGGGSW